MKIGEAFDPREEVCGFYPNNFVQRLGRFKIPANGRKFSHAHKRVYQLLVGLWGPEQKCTPGYTWLEEVLGISLRSVKMLVKDLEAFGLIRHNVRRGRKKGGDPLQNEYIFLWHPIFEVQEMEILKCKDGRFEVQILSLLKCKNERRYKEEIKKNHHQGIKLIHKNEPPSARENSVAQEPPAKQVQTESKSKFADDDEPPKNPSNTSGVEKPTPLDESKPAAYATPADELKAIVLKRTGNAITQGLLDVLRSKLGGEISQDFVDEVNTHNGKFKNFPGFLRDLAGKRCRPASAPVTAEEAAEKNYKCAVCSSRTPGKGSLMKDGKFVPCSCASEEYIAEQVARGVFEGNSARVPTAAVTQAASPP